METNNLLAPPTEPEPSNTVYLAIPDMWHLAHAMKQAGTNAKGPFAKLILPKAQMLQQAEKLLQIWYTAHKLQEALVDLNLQQLPKKDQP